MTISLKNRVAIITGGTLGLGLAISKSFAPLRLCVRLSPSKSKIFILKKCLPHSSSTPA